MTLCHKLLGQPRYWKYLYFLNKVNNALAMNQTRNQWIDLGVHPEACMTIPETCCAAGGAISFWLRIINCSHHGGILTTIHEVSGFRIFCEQFDKRKVYLAYVLDFQSGLYRVNTAMVTDSGWFHVTFNFQGMNDGQGIKIYHNGILVGIDSSFARRSKSKCTPIRPRIVFGKLSTNPNFVYLPINSTVHVDELKFFNGALTQAEIRKLAQSSN